MNADSRTCMNCGKTTSSRFCENCGQRSSVYKVTTRETFKDLAFNFSYLIVHFKQ